MASRMPLPPARRILTLVAARIINAYGLTTFDIGCHNVIRQLIPKPDKLIVSLKDRIAFDRPGFRNGYRMSY